ncbi:MAG: FtsX-like permease family protein [Anaerolineae bacterium]|nr:FtsX-like permease family protein [Gloeobacterales cyanobacterium ES-bin-313]
MRKKVPLAWLQIAHAKVRFVVALAGIALACVLIFVQLGFQAALYDSSVKLHRVLRADIVLISPIARNLTAMNTIPRRRLYQALDTPGIATVGALYIENLTWRPPENPSVIQNSTVLGFDPAQPMFTLPSVNRKLTEVRLRDHLLFDQETKGNYPQFIEQLKQGKTITIEANRRRIDFVGLFNIGSSFGTDGYMVTSDLNFLRLFSNRQKANVNLGVITLRPGADAQVVKLALEEQLRQENDVRTLTYQEWVDWEKNYWQTGSSIGFIFGLGVVMGFVVGIIIVYQILYSDVSDHLKEYATLKAIGYQQSYLLKLIFQESLILASLAFIPSCIISEIVYGFCRSVTRLPLEMTWSRSALVFFLTIVMCIVSGAIAVQKLKSADPADVF